MVKEYQEKGKLPEQQAVFSDGKIKVFGDIKVDSVNEVLNVFLNNSIAKGSYVVLQAYIKPSKEFDEVLHALRMKIMKKYKTAVTVGYGPRFLHSTGQLHKGDAGKGLFIQFTSAAQLDAAIPDNPGDDKSSISFGVLKNAQALGDRQALLDKGREVLRFDLGTDVRGGLEKISKTI
jgi:hypothetical protein